MLTEKITQWLMRAVSNSGHCFNRHMSVSLGSDIGNVRSENQDRIALLKVEANSLTTPPFAAIAVADGMGGMRDGSGCAAKTLGSFFNALIRYRHKPPKERILLAAEAANETVYEYCKGEGGATLSAVLFDAEYGVFTINVGDSRIYALNSESHKEEVVRLTIDDSLAEVVGGSGRELLQFIGMGNGLIPHSSVVPESAKKIVITSDGVHYISHSLLSDILVNTTSPSDTVEQLMTVAKWRGGGDNASAATILREDLLSSLRSRDPGIEIWDPFGTLQIMWAKQDHKESEFSPKGYLEPKPVVIEKQNSLRNKTAKKKKKAPKKSIDKKFEEGNNFEQGDIQFQISVEPVLNEPDQEESGNENS